MMNNKGFILTSPPPPETFHSGGSSGQTASGVTDEATYTMLELMLSSSDSSSWSTNSAYNWAAAQGAGFPAAGDDVDTTLCLCPPGTIIHNHQKKSSLIHTHIDDDPMIVFDPAPLRWCPPQSKTLPSSPPLPPPPAGDDQHNKKKEKEKKKRSREHDGEASTSSKKKKICRKKDEDQRPLVPIEEIEGLMRMVESDSAAAVFLYTKTLHEADVRKDQHRLLVTIAASERVMEFLGAEAAAALVTGKRVEITAVDSRGNVYPSLAFKKWRSSDATVIHSGWNDVVANNTAEKDDVVEVWGYKHRHTHKHALAFNFRKKTTTTTDDHNNNNGAAES